MIPGQESLGEVKISIVELQGYTKEISKQLGSLYLSEDIHKINEELIYFNKNFTTIDKHLTESDIQKTRF